MVDASRLATLGLALTVATASLALGGLKPGDLDDRNVGTGSGDDGGTYLHHNNTIVVDNASSPATIEAGSFVTGDLANLFFINLTSGETYTLVDPGGEEIGDLKAVEGEIRYYQVNITELGTWSLYEADVLDVVGLTADPVQEFEVEDTLPHEKMGNRSKVVPDVPTPLKSVQVCSYLVEDGEATKKKSWEEDTVDVNGSAVIDVELNWTVRNDEASDNISEFFLMGRGDTAKRIRNELSDAPSRASAFRVPVADVQKGIEDGRISLYMDVSEPENDDKKKYKTWCSASGEQGGAQGLVFDALYPDFEELYVK